MIPQSQTTPEFVRSPAGGPSPSFFWNQSPPDIVLEHEYIWVRQEMQKGRIHWLSNGLGLTSVFDDHAGWGNPGGGGGIIRYLNPSFEQSESLTAPELVANPYFQNFNNTDSTPPGLWVDVSNWIYQPAGTDISQHLIAPPFTPDSPDIMLFRHAKLLAEAIPALSAPAGGHVIDWTRVDPNNNDVNMDLASDPTIAAVSLRWPAALEGRKEKAQRWLHGDYKDAAYLYVKGLYDRITQEGELK